MKTVYLDNSATTRTDEEVVKTMLPSQKAMVIHHPFIN